MSDLRYTPIVKIEEPVVKSLHTDFWEKLIFPRWFVWADKQDYRIGSKPDFASDLVYGVAFLIGVVVVLIPTTTPLWLKILQLVSYGALSTLFLVRGVARWKLYMARMHNVVRPNPYE